MTVPLSTVAAQAVAKLDPRHLWRAPVIFVVWVGSVLTTVLAAVHPSTFAWSVTRYVESVRSLVK